MNRLNTGCRNEQMEEEHRMFICVQHMTEMTLVIENF